MPHLKPHPSNLILLTIVLPLLAACASKPTLTRQTPMVFERDSAWNVTDLSLDYYLYTPPGYEDPARADQAWPLLIFLHGTGESGGSPTRVAAHGPPKLIEQGTDFPFLVASPHNPGELPHNLWLTDFLAAFADHLTQTQRVDPDRVYLAGFSLGGYAAWNWAATQPDRFAALVPLAAWGYPAEAANLADVPVRAYHGNLDFVVSINHARTMLDAHTAAGGTNELITLPVGHGAATPAFEDPELIEWLLQQSR
ncbi:MAG: alpha/beta fold hydrolase [Planctomycetota bacterium]